MHLWRKIRRVCLSVSARLKPHKPPGGKGGGAGGGLLKLQDDVKMCGYKDVQVMWNLLNASQLKQIGSAAATTAVYQSAGKCSKRRPSWMAFFWPNQGASGSYSSSSPPSRWVQSSKIVNY